MMDITVSPNALAVKPETPPVPMFTPITPELASTPKNQALIVAAVKELDPEKPESLVFWGSHEVDGLTKIATQLIAAAKSRDTGPVGVALSSVVLQMKGFDVADLKGAQKKVNFISRLWTKAVLPLEIAKQRFDTVDNQIATIVAKLNSHIDTMTRDSMALARLYDENVKAYEGVKLYIEAGKLALSQIDSVELPKLKANIDPSDPISAEPYAKLGRFRQQLERKVSNMEKTRQVLYMGLPTTTKMEENSYNLIMTIQDTIVNNVALWHYAIAQIIIGRDQSAATDSVTMTKDFGNELMVQASRELYNTSSAVNSATERGSFDMDKIKQANDNIIKTLQEALASYEKAAARRAEESKMLDQCQRDLTAAITQTKAA